MTPHARPNAPPPAACARRIAPLPAACARRIAPLLAACAAAACAPEPPPPDDAFLRAHPELAVGSAVVELRGATHPIDHAWYWAPNSFADAKGLAGLLRAGKDEAPADEVRSLSFRRHRTYPAHGWTDGPARVTFALVVAPDARSAWSGTLAVRGAGAPCDAQVRGRGIGAGAYEGTCADGGAVRLALRPWQVETPFLLRAANRAPLGAALPDWPALRARCAALGSRAAPWCGETALPRFTADGTRGQVREPLSGTWIPARDGRVLLAIAWRDSEELLVLPALPRPAAGLDLDALSLRYAPDLAEGELVSTSPVRLRADFDGAVFALRPAAGPPRRVVPDPLVTTGLFGDVLR